MGMLRTPPSAEPVVIQEYPFAFTSGLKCVTPHANYAETLNTPKKLKINPLRVIMFTFSSSTQSLM